MPEHEHSFSCYVFRLVGLQNPEKKNAHIRPGVTTKSSQPDNMRKRYSTPGLTGPFRTLPARKRVETN
jgi:hypothetical protein